MGFKSLNAPFLKVNTALLLLQAPSGNITNGGIVGCYSIKLTLSVIYLITASLDLVLSRLRNNA